MTEEKNVDELAVAQVKLAHLLEEKDKRAAELVIANKELIFQNHEKDKRAAELAIANKELVYQTKEKGKRAAELVIANKELEFQNDEKDKRAAELSASRKAAEANYLRLKGVITNIKEGLIISDREGNLLDWNPAALRMHGFDNVEEARKNVFKFAENFIFSTDKEDLLPENWPIPRLLRSETFSNFECRVRRKDLDLDLVLNYNGAIILNSEGDVELTLLTCNDITERVKIEKKLHLRERAIEASSEGVIITDPCQADNPIVYANKGFERITGYSRQEVIGKNCRFLAGKDTDPEESAKIGEAIEQGTSCRVELKNYRKNGKEFWNLLSLAPVHDRQGKLINFVGVQTDISRIKELETSSQQTQKMEAVGQLAGGIAHDFNNLVTIIKGYSEILAQKCSGDPDLLSIIDEVQRAGSQAAALTRQLLAFSRKEVASPQVVSLNHVVLGMENMLQRLIDEDIALKTVTCEGLWCVKIDPGLIEQVLLNLVVNARDAMHQAGEISITTSKLIVTEGSNLADNLDPGKYVVLTVADSGPGVPAALKDRIFEPFFTTKGKGKGTGLGLSVVHGVISQAGGIIRLMSEEGSGACFRIFLPACEGVATLPAEQVVDTLVHRPATILLAEDEPAVRTLVIQVLKEKGYTVLEASSGEEALVIAESYDGTIDLLITDVVMKGINGRELAEKVKITKPETTILYMSGYTDDAVIKRGVFFKDVNFLQKPFSGSGLLVKVHTILNDNLPVT